MKQEQQQRPVLNPGQLNNFENVNFEKINFEKNHFKKNNFEKNNFEKINFELQIETNFEKWDRTLTIIIGAPLLLYQGTLTRLYL